MNILIVDDIATNRKLLRVILEADGYRTLEAADGVEALQMLESHVVHAIVSDILMPNMDGYRLCHQVRKSAKWRAIPFVIYTSTFDSPGDRLLAESIGADKYLTKPARGETVLAALDEALQRSKGPSVASDGALEEVQVMKHYSQALVNKLEEKNKELGEAYRCLQEAHTQILTLNRDLERRVRERTAELEKANSELKAALTEVNELSRLLPMCAYCRRIRDDNSYWQNVEEYIAHHTKTQFSHGVCPECFEKTCQPALDQLKKATREVP